MTKLPLMKWGALLTVIIFFYPMQGKAQYFDLQGHRGARGTMPENSIPAFRKALEVGVPTLELDVVITKDKKVVVSHEPYFSSKICLDPEGNPIAEEREKQFNIYQMEYEEVKSFDCGSKGNPDYPNQKKIRVFKPLLSEVIRVCDDYATELGRAKPKYNIELKSEEGSYNIYQPEPEEFTKLVYQVIQDVTVTRIIIQSFDHEILRLWEIKHPEYTLALLEESISSPEKSIEKLGFKPDIYSPYYKLLNRKKILTVHEMDIKVIPWTVNNPDDMLKFFEWGADGVITDFPDLFMEKFSDKVR